VFGKGKATSEQPLKLDTVGRCLGYHEAIFDSFSVERGGTGNICLTVSLTSKQSLSHQHVRDALVLLAKRQPMLRAITYFKIFHAEIDFSPLAGLETTKCNPYYTQFPPSLDVSSFAGPNRLSAKDFTENETKNIIQACKANNFTVTGALTAAAHLAFCELIQDGVKGNKDAKLSTLL
jgi:hypothetical protein